MLRCRNHSLYTGITNDFKKRLRAHNEGKASKYTRSQLPVTPVYIEEVENHSVALKRELEIKAMSKEQKEKLVLTFKGDINEYLD